MVSSRWYTNDQSPTNQSPTNQSPSNQSPPTNPPPPTAATLETVIVDNVGATSWTTVALSKTYNDPIVVCSVDYGGTPTPPLIVRLQGVVPNSNSFQLRLQNPGDLNTAGPKPVHCLVVEKGTWEMPDGRLLEATSYSSTVTDHRNSWTGESQIYSNSYQNPVVVGQVMTSNDPKWSVFWSSAPGARATPPSAAGLATGKHVGEDTDLTRATEAIGIIIMEAGHGTSSLSYEAGVGQDSVRGVDNNASGYSYTYAAAFSTTPLVRIVSQVGMDGIDGGWAVLTGGQTASTLGLVIDEDQITNLERLHTTEQVAYIVFEEEGTVELTAIGATPTPPTIAPPTNPPPTSSPPPGSPYPNLPAGIKWQWQLETFTYPNDLVRNTTQEMIKLYDIDLWTNTPQVISDLKNRGKIVACYFEAGTWASYRAEPGGNYEQAGVSFLPEVLGKQYEAPFTDELWLDVDHPNVRENMKKILDYAKAKGCQVVEPDNVQGFERDSYCTGFETCESSCNGPDSSWTIGSVCQADYNIWLAFNKFLADEAHARGMGILLKNNYYQASELLDFHDGVLSEQCLQYNECSFFLPFLAANKAVLITEYSISNSLMCSRANQLSNAGLLSVIKKNEDLDFFRRGCCGAVPCSQNSVPCGASDCP